MSVQVESNVAPKKIKIKRRSMLMTNVKSSDNSSTTTTIDQPLEERDSESIIDHIEQHDLYEPVIPGRRQSVITSSSVGIGCAPVSPFNDAPKQSKVKKSSLMLAGIDRDRHDVKSTPPPTIATNEVKNSDYSNSPGNRTSLLGSFKASLTFSTKSSNTKPVEELAADNYIATTAKRLSSGAPPPPPPPPPPQPPSTPSSSSSSSLQGEMSPRNSRLSRKAPPPPPPPDDDMQEDDLYNMYPAPNNNLSKSAAAGKASKPVRRISHSSGLLLAARAAATKKSSQALTNENYKI